MPAVSLLVPRPLVKTVKTALQARGLFARRIDRVDKPGAVDGADDGAAEGAKEEEEEEEVERGEGGAEKADADTEGGGRRESESEEEMFLIATTLSSITDADNLLGDLNLAGTVTATTTTTTTSAPTPTHNALEAAITTYLHALALPPETLTALLSTAPKRYSVYPPLLLLPSGSFSAPPWRALLPTLPPGFFAALAASLHCTHLAINAPIPASSSTRSPLLLTPLHGSLTSPELWVRTSQNGIVQTWPPARCMFSRGNVKEKARVLSFANVRGAQVVDLYAGIGYFAFSYVKAGAARVWCWDVSAWSVEALRRGAAENGWAAEVVEEGGEVLGGVRGLDERGVRLVVFRESNERAVGRLGGLGVRAVRHVNMGYLPDCKAVWPAAAEILVDGGVAHVHANVAVGAEGGYSEEVVEGFGALLGDRERVRCEHVEVVKTFAPGVVHCVFDIRIEDR